MKKSTFTNSQIRSILKQAEQSINAQALCREHGIKLTTCYNWRAKYSGTNLSLLSRVKALNAENSRLKKMGIYTLLQT